MVINVSVTLSELKISCLDQQRKDAKALKEEHIDAYVKEFMGRPLKEIQVIYKYGNLCFNTVLPMLEKKLDYYALN